MNVDKAINIEDLHRMAKRRLPKIAFDFIEGGLEDERGLETNTSAFHKHQLLPRYLVDVSTRDQSKTIFGQTFSSPFGISPTGGVSLFRNHGDLMLAEAARDANIPYIMSGASNETIEAAAKIAGRNHWYQLYSARDPKINADRMRRVGADRRHAGRLEARAQYPQRLWQYSRRAVTGAQPQAVDSARGSEPSRLDRRVFGTRRRHPDARQLATLCAGRRRCRAGIQIRLLGAPVQRADLARSRDLPQAVSAGADRQRHHEPGRCVARDRCRLRRHSRLKPWRPPARPGAGLARRVAGNPRRRRGPADPAARQRGAARRRYSDRAVSRRRFLLYGAPDPVWCRRRRACRGQKGDRDLCRGDRFGHGTDRLPESRPARARFPVARRVAAQRIALAATPEPHPTARHFPARSSHAR